MRFLIDMPLSPGLAAFLVRQGHDAVHADSLELSEATDREIMARARNEGMVVITADLDFTRLLALGGGETPGLILLRGGNYSESEATRLVDLALKAVPESELNGSVIVIEKERIRRRRLPLRPREG